MRPLWRYYNPHRSYRIDKTPVSPVFEVALGDPGLINPLPRFSSIFIPLMESDLPREDRVRLENVLIHYLARLDLFCGLDRRELHLKRLHGELKNGLWGEHVGSVYTMLNDTEQRAILNLLYERELRGGSGLERALKKWFPGALIYRVLETGEIILAIPRDGDEGDRQRLELILELFAPIRQTFQVYWQKVPCLLDDPEGILDTCVLG